MSTPSTIRNTFITKITALFPNKTRIPKPRIIDQNNDNLLKDGWGIFIGPSSPSDQDLGFHFSTKSTDILIVITEKIYRLESNSTSESSVEDSLLTDRDLIIDAAKDILREGVDSNLIDLSYVGDDGGEFIFGDKNNYLALTINFALQYKQDLSYCV